jgi:hypothetical protein
MINNLNLTIESVVDFLRVYNYFNEYFFNIIPSFILKLLVKIPRFQSAINKYQTKTTENSIIFLLKKFVSNLNVNSVEEFARPLFVS